MHYLTPQQKHSITVNLLVYSYKAISFLALLGVQLQYPLKESDFRSKKLLHSEDFVEPASANYRCVPKIKGTKNKRLGLRFSFEAIFMVGAATLLCYLPSLVTSLICSN